MNANLNSDMMIQNTRLTLVSCLFVCLSGLVSSALALELCPLFSNNTVLQRDQPVPVWGWDEPGTKVTVEFAG